MMGRPMVREVRARAAEELAAATAAYGSIRQHTSAYASIRQHTSEYVSIRSSRGAGSSDCGQRLFVSCLFFKYFCTSKASKAR
jgi:hypothetical protein